MFYSKLKMKLFPKKSNKNIDQGFIEKVELLNSCAVNNCYCTTAEELPPEPEMYYKIYQYLKKKSLQGYYRISWAWIRITYVKSSINIYNCTMKRFLEYNIDYPIKVTSFRIKETLEEGFLGDLFTKIGKVAQYIYIDFGSTYDDRKLCTWEKYKRQKLIFSMVLKFCTKLKTLKIKNRSNDYYFIWEAADDKRHKLTLANIQNFSVTICSSNLAQVRKLVLNMPKLRSLSFNCKEFGLSSTEEFIQGRILTYNPNDGGSFTTIEESKLECIADIIFDHSRKYNGKHKEISLVKTGKLDMGKIIKQLLHISNKYKSCLNIKCKATRNSTTINFERTEEQLNKITFRVKKDGIFKFSSTETDEIETMDISQLSFCRNLRSLVKFM